MDAIEYERFVKRHFRAIYEWCSNQMDDEPGAAVAAQRIVLELYRSDRDAHNQRSTSA